MPIPERIISAEPKSRPPAYTPELTALLTSSYSRSTKPLDKKALITPPTMSVRVDPSTDEARLLGPLSKRRQVNIRWRYFVKEWKKVYPPLQVVVRQVSRSGKVISEKSDHTSLQRAGIRGVGAGMQGTGVFEEVQRIVNSVQQPRPSTRRESGSRLTPFTSNPAPSIRWLRRRYRQLLGRLPILAYSQSDGRTGQYTVSIADDAILNTGKQHANRIAEVDTNDRTWLQLADERDKTAGSRSSRSLKKAI